MFLALADAHGRETIPSRSLALRETTAPLPRDLLMQSFDHGLVRRKGRTYKATHEPIITKALFDRVQNVMGFVQKPKLTKHDFTFAGVMTCAHCGCAITAERKKGKYVYYHCTNGKAVCENVIYVREEVIESEFAKALAAITVPEHIVEWTREALLESSKEERSFQEKRSQA